MEATMSSQKVRWNPRLFTASVSSRVFQGTFCELTEGFCELTEGFRELIKGFYELTGRYSSESKNLSRRLDTGPDFTHMRNCETSTEQYRAVQSGTELQSGLNERPHTQIQSGLNEQYRAVQSCRAV